MVVMCTVGAQKINNKELPRKEKMFELGLDWTVVLIPYGVYHFSDGGATGI